MHWQNTYNHHVSKVCTWNNLEILLIVRVDLCLCQACFCSTERVVSVLVGTGYLSDLTTI